GDRLPLAGAGRAAGEAAGVLLPEGGRLRGAGPPEGGGVGPPPARGGAGIGLQAAGWGVPPRPPPRRFGDRGAAGAHEDAAAVARVDDDRVDAGVVEPAAHPERHARRMVPEALHQLPGIAAVLRPEEAARLRADVEDARLVRPARLEHPEVAQGGRL